MNLPGRDGSNTWMWTKLKDAVCGAEAKPPVAPEEPSAAIARTEAPKPRPRAGKTCVIDTSYLKPLSATRSRFVISKNGQLYNI